MTTDPSAEQAASRFGELFSAAYLLLDSLAALVAEAITNPAEHQGASS